MADKDTTSKVWDHFFRDGNAAVECKNVLSLQMIQLHIQCTCFKLYSASSILTADFQKWLLIYNNVKYSLIKLCLKAPA